MGIRGALCRVGRASCTPRRHTRRLPESTHPANPVGFPGKRAARHVGFSVTFARTLRATSALRLKKCVERILPPWVDLLVKRKTALGAVMSKHNRPAARGEYNRSVKRLLTLAKCEIAAKPSAREQAASHKAA